MRAVRKSTAEECVRFARGYENKPRKPHALRAVRKSTLRILRALENETVEQCARFPRFIFVTARFSAAVSAVISAVSADDLSV